MPAMVHQFGNINLKAVVDCFPRQVFRSDQPARLVCIVARATIGPGPYPVSITCIANERIMLFQLAVVSTSFIAK